MEISETFKRNDSFRTLSSDPIFFKYIFKKTEKIVCAVFYIINSTTIVAGPKDSIIKDAETSAQRLLDLSLMVLEKRPEEAEHALLGIAHRLIELESKLRILNASRILSHEHLLVFQNEVDTLFRSINAYAPAAVPNPLVESDEKFPKTVRKERESRSRESLGQKDSIGSATLIDRKERVLAILKEKGQASIKDISALISDCSEKTIQRELNNLIKDGIIVREGERRWSIYKPA